MAEHDPLDPRESAYRDALLQDEAGRQARHARLIAALPRPPAADAMPVAPSTLARRWQAYALGLLASVLLLAAALVVFRTRTAEPPAQAEPALVASPAASAATVVAQADTAAAATEPSRPAARKGSTGARAAAPRTDSLADASLPSAAKPSVVAEPAAAPPPAAAPAARAEAEPAVAATSPRAETLAHTELPVRIEMERSGSLANTLAASSVRVPSPANAMLLDAASRAELDAARSALAAGASVHARDAQGRTALMLAARAGSSAAAEMLLAAGARKADRDAGGLTAADHAQAQGHADLADRLR
jgi:hypothetical protein